MTAYREVPIPASAGGMRLDRFLALRFPDRSRSFFSRCIAAGEVCDANDRPLAGSARVQPGHPLRVRIAGIAPSGDPPPLPPVLWTDGRLVALDKPAGMLCHPAGTRFAWAAVSLAKRAWPDEDVHLVHRLDRDTSGVLLLTRHADTNRFLKAAIKRGALHKEYLAIVKGEVPWESQSLTGPIGSDDGVIRIRMAVTPDGLPAHTDVSVVARQPGLTLVRCVLHTGRTHQIRVHLHHAGFPLLGDRMYGVDPDVFLDTLEHGVTPFTRTSSGAPRQALHAQQTRVPLPDGSTVTIDAPLPPDLQRWWADPGVLPHDGA